MSHMLDALPWQTPSKSRFTRGPRSAIRNTGSRASFLGASHSAAPGGSVRTLFVLTAASCAVVAVACGRSKSVTAMNDDLKQDLQLATATNRNVASSASKDLKISPDEISPESRQANAVTLKKHPGPKVIRTSSPEVKASPNPVQVAALPRELPQVQAAAASPTESDSPAPSAPPMARPAPVPMPSVPGSAIGGDRGDIGTIGSNGGGGVGVIIRGGGIGDDDHCDPHGRRPGGGGVYIPRRGIGGTRIPITPIFRPTGRR
jgi:hypothetical protein